jgi:peptide/nickel transport system substrate-binding protein
MQASRYVDSLVLKVIPDAAARYAAFETGALDLGRENPVPLTDLPRLTQLPQLATETRGYRSLEPLSEIDFNLDHPILKDLRVRQAIAHGINPQIVQKTIAYGYADISPTPITPVSPFHDANSHRMRSISSTPRSGWMKPVVRARAAARASS